MLDALAAQGAEATGRTGINVWVPVADETAAVTRLRDAGWAISPGTIYRLASPTAVRVTVSRLVRPTAVADALTAAQRPGRPVFGA